MNVTCASCQTVFRVDPAKVPSRGVRARCSVCSGVFWVRHPAASAGPVALEPEAVTEVGRPAPEPAAPPPAAAEEPAAPPVQVAPPAPPAPAPSAPRPVEPERVRPPMPPGPVVAPVASGAPAAPPPGRPLTRPAGPAIPPRPAVASVSTPPAAPRPPVEPRPEASTRRAEEVLAEAAAVRPPPPPPPPAQSVVPPAARPAPAAAGTAAQPKKRRVNPFLSQDPAAKARRLARALISDMVVYHPAKRREGLQHGTLKRLFDEEVKKSWDEYVEQVGKDLAESTPYFYEALNEILADGRPVFP